MYCPSSIQNAENVSSKLQAIGSLQEEASILLCAEEFSRSYNFPLQMLKKYCLLILYYSVKSLISYGLFFFRVNKANMSCMAAVNFLMLHSL